MPPAKPCRHSPCTLSEPSLSLPPPAHLALLSYLVFSPSAVSSSHPYSRPRVQVMGPPTPAGPTQHQPPVCSQHRIAVTNGHPDPWPGDPTRASARWCTQLATAAQPACMRHCGPHCPAAAGSVPSALSFCKPGSPCRSSPRLPALWNRSPACPHQPGQQAAGVGTRLGGSHSLA